MYAFLEHVLLKTAKHDEYEEELKEVIPFIKKILTSPCLGSDLFD